MSTYTIIAVTTLIVVPCVVLICVRACCWVDVYDCPPDDRRRKARKKRACEDDRCEEGCVRDCDDCDRYLDRGMTAAEGWTIGMFVWATLLLLMLVL